MKSLYPQMSFVTEPTMCDIMHVEAATLVSAWHGAPTNPSNPAQCLNLPGPNTLADFLLPGHETWGAYRYIEHNRTFGPPTESRVLEDLRRIASYGYRPCMLWTIHDPGPIAAMPSWETSLPASIRNNDPWIADIRAGRHPGQAAPAGGTPPPSDGPNDSGPGSQASGGSTTPPPAPPPVAPPPYEPIIVVTPGPTGPAPSAGPSRRSGRSRGAIDLMNPSSGSSASAPSSSGPRVMRWRPTPNVTRVVILTPPQPSGNAEQGSLESRPRSAPSRRRSGAAGLLDSVQRQAQDSDSD
jgi:hypothetical protein